MNLVRGRGRQRGRVAKVGLDLFDLRAVVDQGFHAIGIEFASGKAAQEGEGLVVVPGHLVGPLAGERIEDVRHRDDARLDRDILAPEAAQIAAGIERFVMKLDDVAQRVDIRLRFELEFGEQAIDHLEALHRVLFICSCSCGVSGPRLRRMLSGMPILPMSCSGANWKSCSMYSPLKPYFGASALAMMRA